MKIIFTEKEKALMLGLCILFWSIATIMLFQIEIFHLYKSDFWIIPAGLGFTAFMFFIIGLHKL
jgi:hypothetical protein